MAEGSNKSIIRRQLRDVLAAMPAEHRHRKSVAACDLIASSPEFHQAWVIMLFLSTAEEVDTAPLALRAWQSGKTVVVPKVSWDQRRILPVEIASLQAGLTVNGTGVREPVAGKPVPVEYIDLVIVPGIERQRMRRTRGVDWVESAIEASNVRLRRRAWQTGGGA